MVNQDGVALYEHGAVAAADGDSVDVIAVGHGLHEVMTVVADKMARIHLDTGASPVQVASLDEQAGSVAVGVLDARRGAVHVVIGSRNGAVLDRARDDR